MHPSVPVDNRKALVLGAGARQLIQLFNNRHQLRHNHIQISARPLFQCLRQNRVVGISAGLGDDLNSLVKPDALFAEQTNQLRNNHTRVRIVDLNGSVIRQVMIIAAARSALCKDQLCTGRNHQILLVHAQLTSCLIRIIRVEKQGEVLVDGGLVKGNAIMHDTLVNTVQIKQIQRICARTVAGDRKLIQTGGVLLTGQLHRIGDVRFFRPAVSCKPRVRLLVLNAVFKGLVEQAKMISQPYSVSRQAERRQ